MSNQEKTTTAHGTLLSYSIGFILSIVLTLAAYFGVVNHLLSSNVLIAAVLGLAVVQLLVQLLFFLHLGRESKPRLNLISFLFAGMVVLIVVFGSLWIMYNLDYNMSGHQADEYLLEEEGIRK